MIDPALADTSYRWKRPDGRYHRCWHLVDGAGEVFVIMTRHHSLSWRIWVYPRGLSANIEHDVGSLRGAVRAKNYALRQLLYFQALDYSSKVVRPENRAPSGALATPDALGRASRGRA